MKNDNKVVYLTLLPLAIVSLGPAAVLLLVKPSNMTRTVLVVAVIGYICIVITTLLICKKKKLKNS